MMQNLLNNWKTTSAGLLLISGSIIHLAFAIKKGTADENTWTTSMTAVFGGIGLMFAGDATASKAAHDETKEAITAISQAVKTGDTTMLSKNDLTKNDPTKPNS